MNMGLEHYPEQHTTNNTYFSLYEGKNVEDTSGGEIPMNSQNGLVNDKIATKSKHYQTDNEDSLPSDTDSNDFWTPMNQYNSIPPENKETEFSDTIKLTPDLSVSLKASKYFTCEVCGKSLTTKQGLEQHSLIHVGEKNHICPICNKAFLTKFALKRHCTVHSTDKPYVCNVCGRAFPRKKTFTHHMYLHSDQKPFSCDICSKQFIYKNLLNVHLRMHNGERPYKCHICQKGFARSSVLDSHYLMHSKEANFTCELCGKTFKSQSGYRDHKKGHSGAKNITCDICKEILPHKLALRLHRKICNYSCRICDKTFNDALALEEHQKNHSSNEQAFDASEISSSNIKSSLRNSSKKARSPKKGRKTVTPKSLNTFQMKSNKNSEEALKVILPALDISFEAKNKTLDTGKSETVLQPESGLGCTLCRITFHNENSYNIHMQSHAPSKSSDGGISQKGYTDPESLEKPFSFHNKLFYQCNTCKQLFQDKKSVLVHSNVHSQYFQCNTCFLVFQDKESVLDHIKVHSDQKVLYACKNCNKAYNKDQYKHHKCDKMIMCEICKKWFQGQLNLNQHLQLHARRKRHVCNMCKKGFMNEQLLKNHKCIVSLSVNNVLGAS